MGFWHEVFRDPNEDLLDDFWLGVKKIINWIIILIGIGIAIWAFSIGGEIV